MAVFEIPVLVDGISTHYLPEDSYGGLEGSATASPRQYPSGLGTAEERGILEFDLGGLEAGTPLRAATLVVDISVITYTSMDGVDDYPNVEFVAYAGNDAIDPFDYFAPGQTVGEVEATDLGVVHVALNHDTLEQYLGGSLGLRAQNPTPDGPWLAIALKVHPNTALVRPHLLLETDEDPTLSLAVTPSTIREGDGANAAAGTLTRTGDLSQPLTVTLSSSDASEAAVPSSVTFAAGQSEVSFPIEAVDDDLHDGTLPVTITATASIPKGTHVGLDPSFGEDGLAATNLDMVIQGPYAAMAIQPDGKIIAAGEDGSGGKWRVTRFHPNGTLDVSFGNGLGYVDTYPSVTSGRTFPTPNKVLVQPDGKILVGGKFNGGTGWAGLVRYNSNGSLDATFGFSNSGVADLANITGWVEDIALHSDGRITLAIANNGSARFRIVNLTPSGTYDPNAPQVIYSALGGLAHQVEILPDGKILLAGSNLVARLNPNYSIDTSFGDNGSQFVAWGGSGSSITEMAIDDQGRIVLAGHEFISNNIDGANWTAARLTPEGQLDVSFSDDGKHVIDFAAKGDLANTLVLQPDGKILIGGYATSVDSKLETALVRLNDNGSLDLTFSGDGRSTHDLLPTDFERIFDMALTDAGQLVALTGFGSDYRLARFDVGEDPIELLAEALVQVQDNDNFPPFLPESQEMEVPENSPAGTAVGSVVANDGDGDPLAYEIVGGNDDGIFTISADGLITVADGADLNFEMVRRFDLTIRATDNGTPPLSAEGVVTIGVTDVNEAPTVSDALWSVAENSAQGSVVGTLAVTDPDFGQGRSFQILSGNTDGAFAIDANGVITVANAAALNFETNPEFVLTVQAQDNGTPSLSDQATVTVKVGDVNEPPSVSDAAFMLAENSPAGTTVGSLAFSDPDQGQSQTFAITAGNTDSAFAIDANGVITVANAAALDFETNPDFALTVVITDTGSPAHSDTATVVITLANVNEAPALNDETFSLPENSDAGAVVGVVSATDPDAGQTSSYAITSGNTEGAFAIDANGVITVANADAVDFETTPQFNLTIQVTDNGSPVLTDTASVVIQLTNVDESNQLDVDLEPGDSGNEIALKGNKKVQFALLSSATLDARDINLDTLRIGRTGTEDSVNRKHGKVQFSLSDVNGDGRLDVVVTIDVRKTGLDLGDTQILVTAQTISGLDLWGSDAVVVKKNNGALGKKD